MGCVIAEEPVLWSLIPKRLIFKYVHDEELKEQARELIKDHLFVRSFDYEPDLSIQRRIYFLKNQLNYVKKYKKYFGNKGLHE